MTIKKYISILTLAFVMLLNSCNDLPTNIGYPLDTLYLEAISTTNLPLIKSSKTFFNRLDANWPNPIAMVGKFKDLDSYSFLRFGTLNLDTFQFVQESDIVSSKLRLYPNRYTYGDSVASDATSFGLYEISKVLTDSTTYDSIIANGGISTYYSGNEFGSYSGKIDLKDTMNPIIIPFTSNKIIKKWLDMAADITSPESQYKNGIALVPNSNSKVINRFAATYDSSRVEVVFNNSRKGKIDTIYVPLQTISNYINTNTALTDSSIYLQYGVSLRGLLDFDLSMIPKYSSIISSELELTFDSTRSYFANYGSDSTIAGVSYTDIYIRNPVTPYLGKRTARTNKFVFPSITSAVERWVRNTGTGSIILIPQRNLTPVTENIYVDRLVFWGQDAKVLDNRPKLKIIYSKRPKN